MTSKLSRRSVLRGRLSRTDPERLRPPGAQGDFARLCTGCGDCARACPEGIVIRHSSGEPVLDFTKGACTFCNACAEACETGALIPAPASDWPWRAVITDSCLSLNGIACRACEDACDARAIRFRLMTAGRAAPVLDADQCTGCGECAFTCPAGAVSFEARTPATEEIA
ncbi:ferredoxin-type protein NapF [Ponticoccus gilvus]|nr:ferredoxin-type protein NapF [Enemella evansiae]